MLMGKTVWTKWDVFARLWTKGGTSMKVFPLSIIFFLAIQTCSVHAQGLQVNSHTHPIGQQSLKPQSFEHYAFFDINNISAPIFNNGKMHYFIQTGPGFEWPKGSGMYAVYSSGLWLAAKVGDTVRAAISEYWPVFQPGSINYSTGLPRDPDDSTFRVYEIERFDTTSWDYRHWPGSMGAPVKGNGKPLLLGEQTLWCVYNDAHYNDRIYPPDKPLGVEVQQTVFGFDNLGGLFKNLMIIHCLIINKSVNTLDSMYFAFWSDPELGAYDDNVVGSDSSLSLWFAYNETDFDPEYGAHPPAVGYVTLQGPRIESPGDSAVFMGQHIGGYTNLPMTAFPSWPNTPLNPDNALEIFLYMKGYWPYGSPFTYGGTGRDPLAPPTRFMFSGEPETGTGWLGTATHRHSFGCSGPFTMSPGDTQEVVMGILVSRGSSNTNSVTKLKNETRALHYVYEETLHKLFAPPGPPPPPEIPELYRLSYNFPNPFNPGTEIQFDLPRDEQVTLAVYNTLGQRVAVLASGFHPAGSYTVRWEPGSAASGVYFYQLDAGRYVKTRKMVLLK